MSHGPESNVSSGTATPLPQSVWPQVLSCAADAVILINSRQQIVYANPAALRMFGYPEEKLLGQPLELLLPVSVKGLHARHINSFQSSSDVARNMSSSFREVAGRRQDGSEFSIDATIFKLTPEGADAPAMGVFLRDVTERKQTARALEDSEHRFRAIADYTNDWESWLGPDGHLLWVNPGVVKVTGYTAEECSLMPDYPLPIIHPDDRQRAREFSWNAVPVPPV